MEVLFLETRQSGISMTPITMFSRSEVLTCFQIHASCKFIISMKLSSIFASFNDYSSIFASFHSNEKHVNHQDTRVDDYVEQIKA